MNNDLIECIQCGDSFEKDDLNLIENSHVCNNCYSSDVDTCEECNNEFFKSSMHEIDNSFYCPECYRDLPTCECCNETKLIDNYIVINTGYRSTDKVCEYCSSRRCFTCDECGDNFYDSELTEFNGTNLCESCASDLDSCTECGCLLKSEDVCEHNNLSYCEDCYNEHIATCSNCCENYNINDGTFDDNEFICNDCYDDLMFVDGNILHEYSYKPDPTFIGKGNIYLGIELETEFCGDSHDFKEIIKEFNEKICHFAYLKKDGSLSHLSFEIVTEPLSWNWIKEHETKDLQFIFNLSQLNFKYSENCGMHVHVEKSYFSKLQIYKLLKFFNNNQDFIFFISSRLKWNFDRWCPIKWKDNFCKIASSKKDESRSCINFLPAKTIEFRLFTGTLDQSQFMSNLQFLISLFQFCNLSSINDITLSNYIEFLSNRKKEYNFIYEKSLKMDLVQKENDLNHALV